MKHRYAGLRLAITCGLVIASVGLAGPVRNALAAISCVDFHTGEPERRYGWTVNAADCLRVTLPYGAEFVRIEFSVESGSFDVYGGKGNVATLDNQFNFGPITSNGSERFLDLDAGPGTYTLALLPRIAGRIAVMLSTLEQQVVVQPSANRCYDVDGIRVCSSSSPLTVKGQAVLAPGGHLIIPLAVACSGAIRVTTAFTDPNMSIRLYRPDNAMVRSGGFSSFNANANMRGTWKAYVSNSTGTPRKVSLTVDFPGKADCPLDLSSAAASVLTKDRSVIVGRVQPPTPTPTPRPTPTPVPAVGCLSGRTEITSPESGDTVSGIVNIYGTVTCDSGFRYYKFELEDPRCGPKGCFVAGPPSQCNDTRVQCPASMPFARPVDDGLLMTWDTTTIPNGTWVLRLSAVGASGYVLPQQARVRLTIDN